MTDVKGKTPMKTLDIPMFKVIRFEADTYDGSHKKVEIHMLPKHYKSLEQYDHTEVEIAGVRGWLNKTTYPDDRGYTLTDNNHEKSCKIGWILPSTPAIYIDTSIVNHLVKSNRQEWKKATEQVWREIKEEGYSVHTSQVLFDEIKACGQPKRGKMEGSMEEIKYVLHENTEEIKRLGKTLITECRLPDETANDMLHLAHAITSGCNVVLSWNFHHMVNKALIPKFKEVSLKFGYNDIDILSPIKFLEGDTSWLTA